MAEAAGTVGVSPIEISFPLPKALYTTLHIHLTLLATSAMVFLTTTTSTGESQGARPMGSFVYVMPDRANNNRKSTMSTALYSSPGTIDYARRTAQALVRRFDMPVYVGCSVDLSGHMAEEEMETLALAVDAITAKWEESKAAAAAAAVTACRENAL